MTVTVLDPAKLSLFYPKASAEAPQRLRVISQVVDYDISSAVLSIQRLPNIGRLHEEINLDGIGPEDSEPILAYVQLSHINLSLSSQYVEPGTIVSIVGFYDGRFIEAVECYPIPEQVCLGKYTNTLAAMAKLKPL